MSPTGLRTFKVKFKCVKCLVLTLFSKDYAYLAFTIIYVLECAIKLLGLGWKKWIGSFWNWYDFIIAFSALILLIVRFAVPDLWTVRVERYCLIFAAFRLGESIDALQTLYHTIA